MMRGQLTTDSGLRLMTLDALFFFQAEDGIRDGRVTGVQTCALPISFASSSVSETLVARPVKVAEPAGNTPVRLTGAGFGGRGVHGHGDGHAHGSPLTRSEERRVGKECRGGWWRAV